MVRSVSILGWIVVGLIAGLLARAVVKDDRSGCLYTIVIGVLGALLGGWLYSLASDDSDVFDDFDLGSIVVAFLGACLLLLVLQAIAGRGPRSGLRR
jgi:uncharacterized membrane protein YeaQ/YmgE (transglycosylase-associated protein family)